MLLTENDLFYNTNAVESILSDDSNYLVNESITTLSPIAVPIIESSELSCNIINFFDVERFSEENSISLHEAMLVITENNNLGDNTVVVVPDWKLFAEPYILDEMANIVLSPINSGNVYYQFVSECVDAFAETGDENFFAPFFCESAEECYSLLESDSAENDKDGVLSSIKNKLKDAKNWSKTQLTKFWSSLKAKYNEYANKAMNIKGDEKAPWYKKICAYIMRAIDKVVTMIKNV